MSTVTTRLKRIEKDRQYELRIRCVLTERLALKKPPASGKGLGFTDLLALLKLWTQHCIAKNGNETTQGQIRAALPILDCLIPWLTDGARITEADCAAIAGRYTHGSS